MSNHASCSENIYWGEDRLTGIHKYIYKLIMKQKKKNSKYYGHIKGNEYFWGDICKNRIKYVRNFVFSDINTLKCCPFMPYHDPIRPYVNYWFASSEGGNVNAFNSCIAERNQDRLEEVGGACIMYTHFAKGFYENSRLDYRFKVLMDRLSKKNGWFIPVSTLLDYLLEVKGHYEITDTEKIKIERKWLLNKILGKL